MNSPLRGYVGSEQIAKQDTASRLGRACIQLPTQREQLLQRQADLEAQLEAVKEAVALFDKMPEIERLTTLLQQIY